MSRNTLKHLCFTKQIQLGSVIFVAAIFVVFVVGHSKLAIGNSAKVVDPIPVKLDLFTPVDKDNVRFSDEQESEIDKIRREDTTSDVRMVKINVELLRQDTIRLNAFADSSFIANRKRMEKISKNKFTWIGNISDPAGSAILAVRDDNVTGTIRAKGELYSVRPVGEGLHAIIRVDETKFPQDHPPDSFLYDTPIIPLKDKKGLTRNSTDYLQDQKFVLKVLVAYTPSVNAAVTDIEGFIQLAIAETNESYINSNVNLIAELGHSYEVRYTESGSFSKILDDFSEVNDGNMDEVHTLRHNHAADVAILLINKNDYCGLADAILASEDTAFAVVHYTCATGYYSFAHEMGHLQGARHNPEADPTTTPFSYGHGYYYEPGSWRTVMSYRCSTGCTRIPYWSNPDVQNGGSPMGTTATHNNAMVLNETAPVITDFEKEIETKLEYKYEYAAKYVCGLQKDPWDMRLTMGYYATAINIHNPNKDTVKIFKKLALTFPPKEQRPGKIIPIGKDELKYDEALEVDCEEIEKALRENGITTPYSKGFVILQSPKSLDVTAVYTTAALDNGGRALDHSSIDVEQIKERSFVSEQIIEPPPHVGNPKWTFMVYLDADNNLEGAGIDDFLEMASVGSNADVNIVVQMDRVSGYDTSFDDWTGTRRFLIKRGDTPSITPIQNLGEQNMGDPSVLKDFVEWAVKEYPAEHYALSIWNHGDGFRDIRKRMIERARDIGRGEADMGVTRAVASDDTDGDILYMKEVQQALEVSNIKFDIVGFDACLMGMVEVGYALRNIANYVVGSEELEPGDGWPYDTILADLVATPSLSPKELAGTIVTRYGNSYSQGITQASADISKLNFLVSKIDNFTNKANSEWANLRNARTNTRQYHPYSWDPGSWGTDLWHFADNVYNQVISSDIKTVAQELKDAIDEFVTAESHSPDMSGSHGIAIYFPPTETDFNNDPDHTGYEESNTFMTVDFVNDHRWDNWLQDFYSNIP